MRLSEAAEEVIRLAEAMRSYRDVELPKRHRDYPLIHPGEDSGPPPPAEKQLNDFLGGLPEDLIYTLVLLMHLGRGDFDTHNLASQYEIVKRTFRNPGRAASQMIEKASLADYLADGLVELKNSGIDADHLAFTPVRSGS